MPTPRNSPNRAAAAGRRPSRRRAAQGTLVLLVDPDGARAGMTAAALERAGIDCVLAPTLDDIPGGLRALPLAVLFAADRLDGAWVDAARSLPADTAALCLSGRAGLTDAVAAMQAGVRDLIPEPLDDEDFAVRIRAACAHALLLREESERVRRLELSCKRLTRARREVSRQIDTFCNDLADAYRELTSQMNTAALAGEFEAALRDELDVEEVLRCGLEFILARTGPTNAAIYLPTSSGDYNLGAYVNYDRPKGAAEVMFDHLADALAPRFDEEPAPVALPTPAAIEQRLGENAHWLGECGAVVAACRYQGECLAVLALFRDQRVPYKQDLPAMLAVLADVFARRLAHVVHVHNRHRPDNAWPGFGPEDRDVDDGMAA